jgi:hypothetical protein
MKSMVEAMYMPLKSTLPGQSMRHVHTIGLAVLVATSLLGSGTIRAEDYPFAGKVGQHGWIDALSGDWWICRSHDVFQKFKLLMKEDSDAAFKLAQRDCARVRDQTEVIVEDTKFFDNSLCVRPVGEPDCGWVIPGYVTRAPCATNWMAGCSPRRDAAGRLMTPLR